ncbi:MAG: hypothetical protein L3J41_10150 [Melioribacteraceae bacterium]|nr:hypothetical protein [Melioribacteraceae bacterium]
MRDIFVDVFGYILAPDENHNLAREFKNIADSKKADGAILKNGIKVRKDLLYSYKVDGNYKPFLLGKNINIFSLNYDGNYIHYLPKNEKLYTNQAFRTKDIFEQEKLIVRQILGKRIITTFVMTTIILTRPLM